MENKKSKTIIFSIIAIIAVVLLMFSLNGLPGCKIKDMEKVDKVTVTRFSDNRTVTVTATDDIEDEKAEKPFMRFALSKNMVNMITYLPIPAGDFEPEYNFTFYMKDGSTQEYNMNSRYIQRNGKTFRQHHNSEYETFTNITDGMYFREAFNPQ